MQLTGDCTNPLRSASTVRTGAKNSAVIGPGFSFGRQQAFRGGRSPNLTSFWHCGPRPFSFRTTPGRGPGNHPSTVLAEDFAVPPRVWHADSQRKDRSSGWSGQGCPFDFGCVAACHPASRRASASYLPLRADWAACAWALRGCARSPDPSAPTVSGAPPNKESFR